MRSNRSSSRLNLSSHANVRSTRMRNAWIAALNSRLRPRGTLAVTRILLDVGDHTGIENALAIVDGIKAAIEIEISTSEVQPDLFGHILQRFQALREQDHVRLVDGRHGDRC